MAGKGVIVLVGVLVTISVAAITANYVVRKKEIDDGIQACTLIKQAVENVALHDYELKCRVLFEKVLPVKTRGWQEEDSFHFLGNSDDWRESHKKVNQAFDRMNKRALPKISKLSNGWVSDE